jgi:prepilin-type N-terminal cleavage/methylation domain-containing protein
VPRPRHAFTLVELLTVIGIIAILASLTFPATALVKRQVNNVKCGNNLRQLSIGIMAYRQDHDDGFPGSLRELFDPLKDGNFTLAEADKLLTCPADISKGTSDNFNRTPPSWGSLADIYAHEGGKCSYLYESSSVELEASGTNGGRNGPVSWFTYSDTTVDPAVVYTPKGPTWADGKRNQQRWGNFGPGEKPAAFSDSSVPVIRCYWHHQWTGGNNEKLLSKVNNVGWAGNVLWSIPQWEHSANPKIPLNE